MDTVKGVVTGKPIKRPENNKDLIRLVSRSYWEATGKDYYPDKKVVQYVLCSLRQDYVLIKKDDAV